MKKVFLALFFSLFAQRADASISDLKLPKGFNITQYAKVPGARSLALGPEGTLFVSTQDESVYALPDKNQDHKVDQVIKLKDGLNSPNGLAVYKNDLYIAESGTVYVVKDVEKNLKDPKLVKLKLDISPYKWHGWRYIKFDKKGSLYMGYGAPCNVCNKEDFALILRFSPPEYKKEIVARGVRNTVGFDFHPTTDKLWFTDNGRDMMGDDMPSDELNILSRDGEHFGFPFCHQGDTQDPNFNQKKCSEFTAPKANLGAHVAALGMAFTRSTMFPKEYQNSIFIAEHGSWNRSKLTGYVVSRIPLKNSDDVEKKEVFIEGWLNEKEQTRSGRPVDMTFLKDGSLVISDDHAGVVYRVTYSK